MFDKRNDHYERGQLEKCFAKGQAPENWPKEIPFQRDSVVISHPDQRRIDERLDALVKDFQRIQRENPFRANQGSTKKGD